MKETAHQNLFIPNIIQNVFVVGLQYTTRNVYREDMWQPTIRFVMNKHFSSLSYDNVFFQKMKASIFIEEMKPSSSKRMSHDAGNVFSQRCWKIWLLSALSRLIIAFKQYVTIVLRPPGYNASIEFSNGTTLMNSCLTWTHPCISLLSMSSATPVRFDEFCYGCRDNSPLTMKKALSTLSYDIIPFSINEGFYFHTKKQEFNFWKTWCHKMP